MNATCTTVDECSDGNLCTVDTCTPDGCEHEAAPQGTRCPGGLCDGTVCQSGRSGDPNMPKPIEAPPIEYEPGGPAPFLYPSQCETTPDRQRRGDLATGVKTIRVRVRIARSSGGMPAVDPQRVLADLRVLNDAFFPAKIAFRVIETELLPPDDAAYQLDYTTNALWKSMCTGNLARLGDDADSSGSFGAPASQALPAGFTSCRNVECADVNGDRKVDLLCGLNYVAVFRGAGDGTLLPPTVISVTNGSGGVATGDLDRDGDLDLVVPSDWSGKFAYSVLLGSGNGTFQAVAPTSTINGWLDLPVIVDLDRDGIVDLLLPSTQGLGVMRILDVNGDGTLDLVTHDDFSIRTLFGSGSGTFPTEMSSGGLLNARGLDDGDFNEDGRADLAVHGFDGLGAATITILVGDGTGGFAKIGTTNTTPQSRVRGMAVSDLDLDGHADVVVTTDGSQGWRSQLVFLDGKGDGTLRPPELFPLDNGGGGVLLVADLDNDGKPDIVQGPPSSPQLRLYFNASR